MTEEERKNVRQAIEVLKNGGVIQFRGDTDEFIACDVSNKTATEKLSEHLGYGVLIVDLEVRVNYFLTDFPEQASALFEYAEKPLTIIFSTIKNLPEPILKQGQAAFRITKDPLTAALAAGIRRPLLCIPVNKIPEFNADLKLEFSTSPFHAKDEKIMEIGRNGIFRFLKR